MCVFCLLSHAGVATGEQERIWVADFRSNQAKIAGRIKKTGIPTLPVRQQDLHLFFQIHSRNVTERLPGDNALGHRLFLEQPEGRHDQRET